MAGSLADVVCTILYPTNAQVMVAIVLSVALNTIGLPCAGCAYIPNDPPGTVNPSPSKRGTEAAIGRRVIIPGTARKIEAVSETKHLENNKVDTARTCSDSMTTTFMISHV